MNAHEALAEIAGKMFGDNAKKVMMVLASNVEVSDEDLAKDLKMDPPELRKLLNDLFEARLVKYRRARDENIGWYKYYWRITDEPIQQILSDRKRLTLSILEKVLSLEENSETYVCPKCGTRYTVDEAENNNYTCEVCGEVLEPFDNTHRVEKLKRAIELLGNWDPSPKQQASRAIPHA
ncbi:TFIIB-type zinc ribbon-containing protein [Thermofilum pendens]|uniref:Transcription factor E n=1 Tax=Thermofilum pendens (strain DSM 2475 / Hrk 5) TaxID=368408 RepID=TFE_THEPD|nr:TFIIB-type zinc ribbon-containing protein [Thermofilum pendens]A1RY32.1 RecName: Full=Transcription factor E; Short=TFE; AltName: Full=TFIIE subunit alpha homolog; AltName: Full=Transcription initiation factor TFIIE [Thermofilum pendens Hrk 5]ABL78112.1 Transcription factor IIE (TFIIE), alpha subunit [Thermofilum pendens Hrk 5]